MNLDATDVGLPKGYLKCIYCKSIHDIFKWDLAAAKRWGKLSNPYKIEIGFDKPSWSRKTGPLTHCPTCNQDVNIFDLICNAGQYTLIDKYNILFQPPIWEPYKPCEVFDDVPF